VSAIVVLELSKYLEQRTLTAEELLLIYLV
jgi:hypothetical protein